MKRTPELRTLSEDHHHGPVQARQLGRATEADSAEAAVQGFLAEGHRPPLLEVKDAGPRVEPWVELSYAPWPGPGDSEAGGYD
jgi:hypothetical protein